MKALKITSGCVITEIDVKEPLHKTIGEELGGYFETVRPRRVPFPLTMIVDEEGLLKGLPHNPIGCYMYETDKHNQPIVGDIIIMREEMTNDGIVLIGLEQSHIDDLLPLIKRLSKMFGKTPTN